MPTDSNPETAHALIPKNVILGASWVHPDRILIAS